MKLPRALRGAGALAAVCLLASCSLAPEYQRPPAPLPTHWSTSTPLAASTPASTPATESAALDWRAFVTDAALAALIDEALANNRDLQQTLLNVVAARAEYRIQRADRLPALQLEATGTRQRLSDPSSVQSSYQAGIGLTSFELDLFGRVRSLSDAALHDYLATHEAADSARVSLVAELVHAYLSRDGALQRQRFGSRMLEAHQASLRLVEQRREHGLASDLDRQEAIGLLRQAEADLQRIERELHQTSHALGLLVGTPEAVARLPAQPNRRRLLVQDIAAGLPSDLLARRPDIRAAEHRLQARNADIGAARAAFLPSLSLTGMAGSGSAELSDLFGAGQRAWSFMPRMTLPIFNGGANRATLSLAEVRKDIAVAAYEQAVQTAFREVSDALAATDTLRHEEIAQRHAAEASSEAVRLSELRYRRGIDNHLRLLDAQRSDFANQMALIEVETQRQLALVALFRALGGAWLGQEVSLSTTQPARPQLERCQRSLCAERVDLPRRRLFRRPRRPTANASIHRRASAPRCVRRAGIRSAPATARGAG